MYSNFSSACAGERSRVHWTHQRVHVIGHDAIAHHANLVPPGQGVQRTEDNALAAVAAKQRQAAVTRECQKESVAFNVEDLAWRAEP